MTLSAAGQVAANEIGNLAHETKIIDSQGNQIATIAPQINTAQQLTLHAALGCAMALAGSNNCAAGAAAGVAGEAIGSLVYNNGNPNNAGLNKQNTIATAQISGALAAALITGPDDGDSVFAGSQIGRNAAENNVLFYRAGTNSDPRKTDKEFIKSMEETTGQKVVVLAGILENTDESRNLRANEMAVAIKNYQLQPNEPLMLASHSHGENVSAIATNLDLGGKKIDVVVGLGGPQRSDYVFNFNAFAPNAKLINVYDVNDGVQVRGGIGSETDNFLELVQKIIPILTGDFPAGRILKGFNNVPIEQTENHQYLDFRTGSTINHKAPVGPYDAHVNLDTAPIWNTYVKPLLQK